MGTKIPFGNSKREIKSRQPKRRRDFESTGASRRREYGSSGVSSLLPLFQIQPTSLLDTISPSEWRQDKEGGGPFDGRGRGWRSDGRNFVLSSWTRQMSREGPRKVVFTQRRVEQDRENFWFFITKPPLSVTRLCVFLEYNSLSFIWNWKSFKKPKGHTIQNNKILHKMVPKKYNVSSQKNSNNIN